MNFKHKLLPLLLLPIGLLLTGCRDDDLLEGISDDAVRVKEPALVFDFNLTPFDEDGSSTNHLIKFDHGEEWENYIDPSKFRVIFCDRNGFFLFETDRRHLSIISKDKSWTGDNLAYRVTIPQSDLYTTVDREEGQNEAIRQALEEDGFKVAVLANWPNFVEGPREIDPETNDEMLGAADDPTDELNFKWDSSQSTDKDNNHISYLSHCKFDNVYGVRSSADVDGLGPYSHLPYHPVTESLSNANDGQMGVYSSWVQYLYRTQADAALAIRKGRNHAREGVEFTYKFSDTGNPETFTYTPYSYTRTVDALNVYKLENIWRLWNFSGGVNCSYHHDNDPEVNEYWRARNENVLIYGLEKIVWPSSFQLTNGNDVLISSANAEARYVSVEEGNTESGYLQLPNVVTADDINKILTSVKDNSTLVTNFKNSAVKFNAYGEGTLRIRVKADPGTTIAVMTAVPGKDNSEVVQYYTMRDMDSNGNYGPSYTSKSCLYDPVDRGQPFDDRDKETWGQGVEYIINPNSSQYLEVYIAAVDGVADFYEIEYMRARHIYDSARNAIMPSYENPIPMYGIQNFDPIGKYLAPNHTFNMSDELENTYLSASDYNSLPRYNYKNIFLLRSVAKVELLFKKSVFKNNMPTHVMMRVMNRTARCEPMDVMNPTEWIWYGEDGVGYNNEIAEIPDEAGKFPGIEEELKNIREYYEHFPLKLNKNQGADISTYRNRTAWFYSFWADGDGNKSPYHWKEPWQWNDIKNIKIPEAGLPYPRIFNTRIDRSDYCRFHRVESFDDSEEYIRYIMYVPEKNISDADSKGDLSASPKVQHIEIRFDKMNDVMNFDDNNCYRIYFTNYDLNGVNMRAYNRDGNSNTYDDAERADGGKQDNDGLYGSNAFLNTLQPIVRNCHYIFTINSINDEQLGLNFSICGAATRNSYGNGFVIN